MHGFMRGFIDMVFRHEERYYLVDWKSNHLGDGYESYHARRLVTPMQEELYSLQYHIYTLALHQYLRWRLPAYRYERHFGCGLRVPARCRPPARSRIRRLCRHPHPTLFTRLQRIDSEL
jgi:ATP-dependent exoDNAse (exonuclease V) beta subunit